MATAGGRMLEHRDRWAHFKRRPGEASSSRAAYGRRLGSVRRRRALKIALWTLVALPLLPLLPVAIPVTEGRTGDGEAPPLALLKGGPPAAMPHRLWIDTDAACGHARDADPDDCFALLLLLRAPGIEVVGISTVRG